MNLLFRLQKFITIAILTDWLEIEECIAFDSALCNKQERKILADYIHSFPHPFGKLLSSTVIPLSVEIYQWAESRRFDLSFLNNAIVDGKFVEKSNWLSYFSSPKVKTYAPYLKTIVVTEGGLDQYKQALPYAKHLQDVNFHRLMKLRDVGDLIKCVDLLKLDFNGCAELLEADVVSLLQNCPNLNTLYVAGCKHMKKSLAKALIVRGRNVTRLDLRQCYQINKTWIRMMVFLMKRLVEFSRDYMSEFSVRQLVWYRGRELKKLSCVMSIPLNNGDSEFITDSTLEQMSSACHCLTDLNVSQCTSLHNKGVEDMARGNSAATLLVVNLKGVALLSGSALRALTEGCPQLREVYLENQNSVKEGGLRSIGTNCKDLRKLHLASMFALTGETLLHIASECRRLESLDINHCAAITDCDAAQCFTHLSCLKYVNVSYCPLVGDSAMLALRHYCPYLAEAHLDHCSLVTIRGVSALMGNLKHLRRITFEGVHLAHSWQANNTLVN